MKVDTRIQYIADDGTSFNREADCLEYEADCKRKAENTTYWSVFYNFDCTEGRGFASATLFEVPSKNLAFEYMLDYCVGWLGSAVCYVQGVSPAPAWKLTEISKERFDAGVSAGIGDYQRPAAKVVLKFEAVPGRDRGAYKLVS
jgi:hypothetical protein